MIVAKKSGRPPVQVAIDPQLFQKWKQLKQPGDVYSLAKELQVSVSTISIIFRMGKVNPSLIPRIDDYYEKKLLELYEYTN